MKKETNNLMWNPPLDKRPDKPRNACEYCVFENTKYRTERHEIFNILTHAEKNQYYQGKFSLAQIFENRKIKYQRTLERIK